MPNELAEVTKRLDAIIALLVSTLERSESPKPLNEQIELLQLAGLGPTDIGRIVGRKPKDITSITAKIKGKRSKK